MILIPGQVIVEEEAVQVVAFTFDGETKYSPVIDALEWAKELIEKALEKEKAYLAEVRKE